MTRVDKNLGSRDLLLDWEARCYSELLLISTLFSIQFFFTPVDTPELYAAYTSVSLHASPCLPVHLCFLSSCNSSSLNY